MSGFIFEMFRISGRCGFVLSILLQLVWISSCDGASRDLYEVDSSQKVSNDTADMYQRQVLEVDPSADVSVLRRSYRRLARQWHPDKHSGGDKLNAQARFQEVAHAYEVISGTLWHL